eukprot:CAMPEP_0196163528 /NCGR_PEP_ID=MMETSP0910-20130528/48386_1 /TAXON_ID=49265 /ORGANISM="Thalassiosira rotula, Strain GSO102" /LENGTH=264 /DNA_ID=CAMNT_0041428485 /DNA_START=75 /DNA_END=867 /DNA_ORIENTATION=+
MSASTGIDSITNTLSTILLRKNIIPTPLSPITNNIASAVLTILYVKLVLEIGTLIRVKFGVPELSRKFVHFAACSIVMFWPLFDVSHWGWRLNVTVPVVMSLRLLYKGAILKDPEDEDVQSMSRTSSPSELLYGPLQMTLIMCYVGLTQFMTFTGIAIMASLVGDGTAALVGIQYGQHKYYRMVMMGGSGSSLSGGGEKSVEGSVIGGMVVGTVGGMILFSYVCNVGYGDVIGDGKEDAVGRWRMLIAYGCVAAVVEATSLRNW